ncbi:DUF3127 domain-containing protein [uncultured Sphaerochaeta sp.]|uniref:DUF3127 domain-containing protein n=1 Tax=uncultured Sphaerochaeta sp. TaxID=886478 RepID=UPI0026261219|nr:DUF3127 domain-containing protein [uncultured Sphaerochaeta sp.]
MNATVIGEIYRIFDEEQVTSSFRKREFVLELKDNPMYPQYRKITLIQDRCSYIERFSQGDMVAVEVNLNGRSYIDKTTQEEKFFNEDVAWRIHTMDEFRAKSSGGSGQHRQGPSQQSSPTPPPVQQPTYSPPGGIQTSGPVDENGNEPKVPF